MSGIANETLSICRKLEKKMERMTEKGEEMKQFLVNLVDKKSMRKRIANMKLATM